MKKNIYYQSVYKRSNPASSLAVKVFQNVASYPRLILEVFIRKNFGERYFTYGKAINAAIMMAVIPVIHFFIFEQSAIYRFTGIQSQMVAMFTVGYATWYVFILIFLYVSYKRKREIKRNPSVFDYARFSLYNGDINQRFYSIRMFGWQADTRQIETIFEPLVFLLIGLVLYFAAQTVGLLLIACAILYRMSYIGAYKLGDDFVMDKIDEQIFSEEMFGAFVEDNGARATRGIRLAGRKPDDEGLRVKLVESFIEDDEETLLAS